ncbi:MAG TPA: serine hydrolase [Polyangiaceae bacterium]
MRISRAALGLLLAAASCHSSSPATPVVPANAGPEVDAALSFDWSALDQEEFGGSWATEGLVVMQGGHLVYERYGAGWTASMPHILYSASKSVGSALIGIAEAQGLLKRTDGICTYLTPPAGADPTLCTTTIADLLHMGSGLAWLEDYSTSGDPTTSNVLQMLYGDQQDMGSYTAAQPRASDAGAVFNYSSGDADLLGLVFKGALKGQDARAWAKTNLFDPAGITSEVFETDGSGTLVFSSWCFMTPRDFALFGELFLDDGVVGGNRVLPEGWVDYSRAPAPSVSTPASRVLEAGAGPGGSYGAMWWLNAAAPGATADTWEYPGEPADGFNAEGHYGQELAVIPSRQLVIARMGNDRDPGFDPNGMMAAAVAAVDAALSAGKKGDQ